MAMPPPMVPAPMTAAFVIGRSRRRLGNVGHLAGRALREEGMAQALRLRRLHELDEQPALDDGAFRERLRRRFHAFDAALRRKRAAATWP